MTRDCAGCGRPMPGARPNVRTCSSRCRQQAHRNRRGPRRVERVLTGCERCGDLFTATAGSRRRFCTDTCRKAREHERGRAWAKVDLAVISMRNATADPAEAAQLEAIGSEVRDAWQDPSKPWPSAQWREIARGTPFVPYSDRVVP